MPRACLTKNLNEFKYLEIKWLGKLEKWKKKPTSLKRGKPLKNGNATEMSSTSSEWALPEEIADGHIFDI